jgi:hypothetical protein
MIILISRAATSPTSPPMTETCVKENANLYLVASLILGFKTLATLNLSTVREFQTLMPTLQLLANHV